MQTVEGNQLAVGRALERVFAWLRENREPAGLSASALSALSRLETSGALRVTELSAREGLTQPGMTTLINRLEDAGLAVREADPLDGRAVRVSITSAGRERVVDHRTTRAARIAVRISELPPAEQESLFSALAALEAFPADADSSARTS
ncbi:MAG TPA: MarR family transcriptional regulator [Galbitalea sp.]|jgi:DNA-binding MarR family transcriptional regulator|nr:MarR family transcriptional regulator [Galbitalea sp.]